MGHHIHLHFSTFQITMAKAAKDWRQALFGPSIQCNSGDTIFKDEETLIEAKTLPIEDAIPKFEYIAIFVGADYCPYCKELAPAIVASTDTLAKQRRCKVIFVSADRDEAGFQASCEKVRGIDVMPYNREKTEVMRDLFSIKTIPALIIVKNTNFSNESPVIIANARHLIEKDPSLDSLNWADDLVVTGGSGSTHTSLSLKQRIFKGGKYGKWYQLGHQNVNPEHPAKMYMDEHAVRIRAGFLNLISWTTLVGYYLGWNLSYATLPIALIEMSMSLTFGMGPLAPISVCSHILGSIFQPKPHWKPAPPKRFAWVLALFFVSACLVGMILGKTGIFGGIGQEIMVASLTSICFILTWLEAVCGFCVGCFMYNYLVVPWFGLEECAECKI